ncbi:hypothetical protein [Acanthopleuribacter pedis]|uniref:Uncharacterized protein n=1 Tax=Acanthopleuribacter pedis TaxID=442870 RepID=A0A8J7U3G2_9BACT|nr:hypothetical protein [Acanthopleuribacter pedis]MBO1318313.1 hypothetical protein [Acanthopleuribacter pedis]
MSQFCESIPESFRHYISDSLASLSFEFEGLVGDITSNAELEKTARRLCRDVVEPHDFEEDQWPEIIEAFDGELRTKFDDFGPQFISDSLHAAVQEVLSHTMEHQVFRFLDPFLEVLEEEGVDFGNVSSYCGLLLGDPTRTITREDLVIDEYDAERCDLEATVWAIKHEVFDWTLELPRES